MDSFFGIMEGWTGRNFKSTRKKLLKLIEEDPDFLDSYSLLADIVGHEGLLYEAFKLREQAYDRALKMITDENGEWPDSMEWGWLENRHVIRALLNMAIVLWQFSSYHERALDILIKLFRSNPSDNIGARYYILAIRKKLTFDKYANRFERGGFADHTLDEWFDKNYQDYPDDFDWWDKWCDENI